MFVSLIKTITNPNLIIMKKLFALCLILLVTSCSTTKTIKFSSTPDEIVKTESLKGFLTSNKNPKVVLRVNGTSENITDTEFLMDYQDWQNIVIIQEKLTP